MTQKFEYTVLEMIESATRSTKANPLNLGGVGGAGGGLGGPPGGFIGQLPQYRVAYDTLEAATLATLPSGVAGISGWSLVDNLNHIRYRLRTLESGIVASGGSITVIDDNTPATYPFTDTIHFSGAGISVVNLGGGDVKVIVNATGSGGGGGYTQEQIEDFVGGMVTGNTETGIAVTYDDPSGKLNFVTEITDSNFGDKIAAKTVLAPSKSTPDGADSVPGYDTASGNSFVRFTMTNIRTYAKTLFDTLYATITGLDARTSVGRVYYLANTLTDIIEDFAYMHELSPMKDKIGATTITQSAIGNSAYKQTVFATLPNSPSTEILSKGAYRFYITAKRNSGTRDVTAYFELYKQDTSGTQTLLVTSAQSASLTAGYVVYELVATGGPFHLNRTDRLVAKIYLQGAATGTDAAVSWKFGTTDGERIEIPAGTSLAEESVFSRWIRTEEVWTRTGNHTFTVTGDVTDRYRKGTKVRYEDDNAAGGGSYEYGVIASSSYSSPNTTVTLITNSDYAMAAATISNTYLSYSENPEGFPQTFSFTTTPSRFTTGYTNVPTINISNWRAIGDRIDVTIRATMNATPGGTGFQTYTLPVTPTASSVSVGMQVSDIYAMSGIFDAGSAQLRAWKYDGTVEATASKIYHYTGSYKF